MKYLVMIKGKVKAGFVSLDDAKDYLINKIAKNPSILEAFIWDTEKDEEIL